MARGGTGNISEALMRSLLIRSSCLVLGLAVLGGCNSDSAKSDNNMGGMSASATPSLYTRLGGEPAIKAVCADFVGRAANDPKVNFFRKDVPGYPEWKPSPAELDAFNKHLVEFVEMAAGGPQKYEGRSMKDAHAGMKITNAQFDAIAGDLSASLDKFNVPAKEKGELMAAVAGTRKDIVELP
jgi:hemoglobin